MGLHVVIAFGHCKLKAVVDYIGVLMLKKLSDKATLMTDQNGLVLFEKSA